MQTISDELYTIKQHVADKCNKIICKTNTNIVQYRTDSRDIATRVDDMNFKNASQEHERVRTSTRNVVPTFDEEYVFV